MIHYSKHSPYHEMACVFVHSGVVSVSDVAEHLEVAMPTAIRIISELQMDKSIHCIGRAIDAGRTDLPQESKLYAKPDVPPLARVEIYQRRNKERKPKNVAGSGVTPIGRYIAPMVELRRDPREHMKLAMLTR